MKAYLLAPREDWIVDRFVNEFCEHNPGITTRDPWAADIVWLTADWAFDQLPITLLRQKVVVTSVHHIVPEKFTLVEQEKFRARDEVTDLYHVPCRHTEEQVRNVLGNIGSSKPVTCKPFWVNEQLWTVGPGTGNLRQQYKVGDDSSFLIGSFQRDTEGFDLKSPKLEKGPDVFCDMVEQLHRENDRVKVVLAGWRRQYVIGRLEKAGVPYTYIERPDIRVVKDLYQTLDLYVVASRYEGGPQAVVECAAMGVPIVSTSCGLAPELLDPLTLFKSGDFSSFRDAVDRAQTSHALALNRANVSEHYMKPSFKWYRTMLEEALKRGVSK